MMSQGLATLCMLGTFAAGIAYGWYFFAGRLKCRHSWGRWEAAQEVTHPSDPKRAIGFVQHRSCTKCGRMQQVAELIN